MQIVVWAARDDEIIMHFEGQAISSNESESGVATTLPVDLDPVSLLVVPHLDRIYAEMGRRCIDREGDPHRWVNPEFHGWWSGRGFRIDVDVATGNLTDLDGFLRHFYASYHPYYNGNQPLIYPQPAGIAVTDSAARFIGWHAITILRVALDPQEVMRGYFFNPNTTADRTGGTASSSVPPAVASASARHRCRSSSSRPGCTSSTSIRSSPANWPASRRTNSTGLRATFTAVGAPTGWVRSIRGTTPPDAIS